MKIFRGHYALLLLFAVMTALISALLLSPEPLAGALVAENGVIETITTFLYLWGALLALFFVRKYAWQKGYGVALVFSMMALREFDYNHFGAFALVKQKIKIRDPIEILLDPLIGLEGTGRCSAPLWSGFLESARIDPNPSLPGIQDPDTWGRASSSPPCISPGRPRRGTHEPG